MLAVEHPTTASTQTAYNPADKVGGIFEGMTGEAVTSSQHHEASVSQTEAKQLIAKPATPATPVNESATEAQSTVTTSQQVQAQKQSATRTVSTPTLSSVPKTISATTTTGSSGGANTHQMVQTLKVANGPPAAQSKSPQANVTVTDFESYIQQVLADEGSTSSFNSPPATLPLPIPGSLSIGGFLQLNGISLTFSATQNTSTNVWSGTVTISANSGSIFAGQNFSATTGKITGTYSFGTVPAGTIPFSLTVNNVVLTVGQALNITSPSITVNYDPSGAPTQTVATIKNATVSCPQFPGLSMTGNLQNFNLQADGFSFSDFTMSSSSPLTIGNFFQATGNVSLSVTGFNLKFDDVAHSTGSVVFSADDVQLFPNVAFLNLHLKGVQGLFDVLDSTASGLAVGSGQFSISVSSLDIAVGDAFTIHMGGVTLNPGQASGIIATTNSATITAGIFGGFETFDLIGAFNLTQSGFSVSNISFTPVGSTVSIGSFLSFSSPTFTVNNFTLSGTTVTSSITFSGTLSLFPGNSNFSSSFTNLQANFDFTSTAGLGALTFTADSFSFSVDNQLTVSAGAITVAPDQTNIIQVGTASVILTQLNGLSGTISGLDIQSNGFTLASATVTAPVLTNLGGVILFTTAPAVTLTNFSYTVGGSLSGTVSLAPTTVTLNPGDGITASGTFSGDYNIKTGTLNATLNSFSLKISDFVSISGDNLVVLYQPATDGSATFAIGGQNVTVLMGSGSGANSVGVEVSNATFALEIFQASPGSTPNYAFDVNGAISIVGLPANSVTFSAANVDVRFDNAGPVDDFVNVDSNPSDAMHLFFSANEQSFLATGLQLTVGNFVTVTGDFGFQAFTDSTTNLTDVVIGASNVNAVLGTSGTNLTITGASLGLLILPGASSSTYLLVANGGTDTLNGVPGLSISATGLTVKDNPTGLDPSTVSGLPASVTTPDGSVLFDFSGLGSGPVTAIEGSITLNVAGFLSLSGDFGFQTFVDSNSSTDIVIGAQNINVTLGTASTNLTINNASLQAVIVPGASGGYALVANGGTDTLNGVPGLSLSASSLSVKINTLGIDPTTLGIPASIPTPDGPLTLDFSTVGATNIKDIEGDLILTVANFVTLQGSFGFQTFTDSTTGATDIAIGATGVTATLGTANANLQITDASLGVLVISGTDGNPTQYALVANGGTDTLNGIPGLSLIGTGLQVKINNLGVDPSKLPGIPTAVHTPDGDVALDFSGLGSGALQEVEGNITLSVLNFVTLQGSFAFQSFTDLVSGQTDLAIAATDLNATLAVGGVSLTINGASLGLVVLPGTSNNSTYALVANGGTDALTGVPGLSLSATGLSVRINNTGDDLTTRIGTTTLTTPTGSVSLDFTGLGTGTVKDIEGSITLTVANFVSLSGDFGFQQFTDSGSGTNEILVGARNVNVSLGTATTNVTITNASLGVLIVPGISGGPNDYALVANGGNDALNGVPGLSLSAIGLAVKINNGVSSDLLSGAAQAVHTPSGNVTLDFSGLGAGTVTDVEGTVTLSVAGFVSLTGSFVFTKQTSSTDPNVTEIVVGASGVNAFLGTADQSVGVAINNANLGLVIYQNTTGHTTTYALHASAPIQVVGLPADIGFSGTLDVDINTTGKAVTESVTTPGGTVNIAFTDGTAGSPDQRNIQEFSGQLTLSIGPQASPLFSLTGDFSFTKTVVSGNTELLIGATNITSSNIIPDGSAASVTIAGGSLGMVIFTKTSGGTSTNGGYAMTASATVTAGGGGSSGSLTLTVMRNTTTNAVNQTVTVGGGTVAVTFTAKQVANGTTAFQTIALSNASLSIDNTLIVEATSGSSSSSGGVTTQTLTGVTLILQDPTSGTVLFSITAASASYSTINSGVTFDGIKWVKGGKDIVLNNISLSIGGYVVFNGTVDIQHYTNSSSAVVTSFNFTNASITLFVNSKPMVSLAGTFAFSYSSAGGFAMTGTPTVTDFSFLGQSLGGGASSNATVSPQATSTETHTLGPITLGTPSVSLSNFSLHLDGTLSVTVTISDPLASISGSVISAAAHNLSGSFNLGLQLNLANPLSPPTNITASGFTLSIGELDITVTVSSNISLVLTALNVTIDPTAGPTADIVSFGGTTAQPGLSAVLTVGGFQFTGGASNFAITGNGSFVAGNNFSVTLGFGASTNSGSLQWPTWLPIQDVSITLLWPGNNFNADPTNFVIDLSASINLSSLGGIPLSLQGTVKDVVIDVGALAAGDFPIISIGALGVSVTGNLFGGTVSGSLIAGVVRFDSNGAVVDSNGNLVSNGTPGVGPFRSVFYGAIDAQFSLGNLSGFEIRIGLTQYGPLSIYIEGSLPDGIILDPDSGLAINDFRGSVTFGQGFPPVTITGNASDALQLRQPGFAPPDQLTLAQWQTQLSAQVATLYSSGNGSNGWSNLGASTITFSAGATLFDAYATQNAFKVDADILFDTSGKFLVIGSATFANSLTLSVKMYADLSSVFNGTTATNPVNILFLMDYPSQSSTSVISTPILSIYGLLQFQTAGGGFQINISGEADFTVMGGYKASLVGTVSMTFTATTFQLTISNVVLNVSYLGNIGTAAGSLTIQKDGSGLDIWGAFLVNANLQALQNVGINAGGQIYFEINTTTQLQPVTLHLISGDVPLTLQPTSFSLYVNGTATFDLDGTQVFELSGVLAIDLNINTSTPTPTFTLTIFVDAQLILGPAGTTLFTFSASGLIYVDQNGFAAKMTLGYDSSPMSGFSISEKWLLVMNTTGETIQYEIPAPVPTSPPTPPVAPVIGPDFSSTNVNQTISYETIINGNRFLVIPNGAPPSGTTNFVNWTPAGPSAYVILLGRGNLTVGSLTISGTLNLFANYSPVTGLSFSFVVNANLNLAINGTSLFSFSVLGAIQINSSGLVAALTISRSAGTSLPGGLGFTLSATFMLEINTTGSPVTVPGTSVTVQPGALVAAFGSLSIPGFTLTGEFDLTVSSTNLFVYVNATANVLGTTLSVQGFAGIYYGNDPGFVLSLTMSIGNDPTCTLYPVSSLKGDFAIQGTFLLQINTCSGTRNFTDPISGNTTSVASGFVISVPSVTVYLFGLNLTGSASFKVNSGGMYINLNLSLDFFGLGTFSFSGSVDSNGNFSITATTSIYEGWDEDGFGGSVSGWATVTLSNSGFSASAGCSVHVNDIGSFGPSVYIFLDGSEFKVEFSLDLGILGSPSITIDIGSRATEPAPPSPVLATQTGTVLVLNLGADVGARGSYFGAVADENYVLTGSGGVVFVSALGYSETFIGVTEIVVDNTYTSGTKSVTINIAQGITAAENINLGSVNNNITTGGGYATIHDYGTGYNTINAGSGGGVYYGGVDGSSNPYSSKGETAINTSSGNFSVVESGYSTYVLDSSALQYGSYLLDLNGVNNVTMNAAPDNGAHVFTVFGWKGTVSINGSGSNNTINVNPMGGSSAASFVLSDSLLQITIGGVTSNYHLSGVQTANLTGDGSGATNSFTVSGWTGGGSITGPSGSTNTIVAVDDRNFTLTNTGLARSGLPTLSLQNIQNASLTGGASANVFNILNWNGNATLTGVGGNDTFNITLSNTGSSTFNVSDATPNSNDVLNLFAGASMTITANQVQVGSQLINYSGVQMLNINGTVAGLTYNIQSTNGTTTTTINVTGTGNVFNIGSTAGILPAQPGTLDGILGDIVLNGGGADVLNVDDSSSTASRTGVMTPTTLDFTGLGGITYNGISVITISLGQGADSFTIVDTITSAATSPVITIDDDGGNDIFNVLETHAITTINGGNGNDTFFVFANSSTLNLNADAGNDLFNIFASVLNGQQSYFVNAAVNIDGGTGNSELDIYGTVLNDSIYIDGTTFTNLGLDVAFGHITDWTFYGLGGNDTFYVMSVVVTTTLVGDGSLPGFPLPAGVTAPDLTGGQTASSFDDTFYIGWQGQSEPGSLSGINAMLSIQGNQGTNTAFVDDSADTADQTFTLTPTTMNSTAMGANGQIVYSGLQVLNVYFGSGNDTLNVNDMSSSTVTTVDGGLGNNTAVLNFSGDFAATSLTLLNFQTASLDVVGNFSGLLTDAGAFTTVTIGGAMTSTGVFNAGSIDAMTVGGDLAGLLNVTGLLNTLAIGGGSPGKIVAGDINYITVQAGYGNKVFQVIEGGIERQIQAAPVDGGTLDSSIHFQFIYDSSAAGDPQIAMIITNSDEVVTPHSFNVSLVTFDSNANFNLALIMASAATGISNLTISGSILFSATAAELNFLGLAATARTGVVLPFDNITGVEVSGVLPIGFVDVAGIEGVAFGMLETLQGQVVTILGDLGSVGKPQVLWNLLGSHATLLQATDTMTVSFNENHNVQVFAQCNSDFSLEYVMTLTDELNDGMSISGKINIIPGKVPTVSSIAFAGDGASVDSRFDVANISSTGSLGDITVRGKVGLGNVTASGIFGSINVLAGAITGVIQTTGIRTDPLTGAQTEADADIGQFTYDKTGAVNGVTTISAKLGITGQIICRGNLISSVSAKALSGIIAVQGDIGVWYVPVTPASTRASSTQPVRYGGINIGGNDSGQIIALGNAFGDITVTGTFSGRIAVQGNETTAPGAGRDGILGNVRLGKFTSSAAVISGGLIGDAAGGTAFNSKIKAGFLAADGDITLAKGMKVPAADLFADESGTSNGAVIDAIFTDSSLPLSFDTGGPLKGLGLIETDLTNIGVTGGDLTGTIP